MEHHHAHAASAYYASSFQSATVLSIDRAGDFRSAVLFGAEANQLTPRRELYFPDSVGDLFNRATDLLGFQPRADEHKVQWLFTSGSAKHVTVFRNLLHRSGSAWPQIDRTYLDADHLTQGGFSNRFYEEIGVRSGEPISAETKADIAASLQAAGADPVARQHFPLRIDGP